MNGSMEQASWYLVQTKAKQEFRALEQLQNQRFVCFLPTLRVQKVKGGKLEVCVEPLFSRYLFIQLDRVISNWAPIRSTRGVSRMVSFGNRFATLPDACVEALRSTPEPQCRPLFGPGERVVIKSGPFAGLEGIFELSDGEARALVLVELMNQPQTLALAVEMLRKAE